MRLESGSVCWVIKQQSGQVMVFVGDKGVDKTDTIEGHGYATNAYQEYECQERDW